MFLNVCRNYSIKRKHKNVASWHRLASLRNWILIPMKSEKKCRQEKVTRKPRKVSIGQHRVFLTFCCKADCQNSYKKQCDHGNWKWRLEKRSGKWNNKHIRKNCFKTSLLILIDLSIDCTHIVTGFTSWSPKRQPVEVFEPFEQKKDGRLVLFTFPSQAASIFSLNQDQTNQTLCFQCGTSCETIWDCWPGHARTTNHKCQNSKPACDKVKWDRKQQRKLRWHKPPKLLSTPTTATWTSTPGTHASSWWMSQNEIEWLNL